MSNNQPVTAKFRTEAVQARPQIIEVQIPTATAIVCSNTDPFQILVGLSSKHSRPVLPGGKIDQEDLHTTSLLSAATFCINRELGEEVGLHNPNVKFFKVWTESERDKRTVLAKTLLDTLVGNEVKHLADGELVRASYGCPDFVFIVAADTKDVKTSEEIHSLSWIDARTIEVGDLSAGHDMLVISYCKSLEK